jgi:hypothetical protein
MTHSNDRSARDAILRRRRAFVAVALAGAGLAAGTESCSPPPRPCLDVAPVEIEPEPPIDDADAGTEPNAPQAGDDAGAGELPVETPSPAEEKAPRPCLDFAPGGE